MIPKTQQFSEQALRSLLMHSPAMLRMADHNYETTSQDMPMDFNYAYALIKLSNAQCDCKMRQLEWKQQKIETVGLLRWRKLDYAKIATSELKLRDIEIALRLAEADAETYDSAAHKAVGEHLSFKVDAHFFGGQDGNQAPRP